MTITFETLAETLATLFCLPKSHAPDTRETHARSYVSAARVCVSPETWDFGSGVDEGREPTPPHTPAAERLDRARLFVALDGIDAADGRMEGKAGEKKRGNPTHGRAPCRVREARSVRIA